MLAAMLVVIAHPASAGALTIRSATLTTPGWSTPIEVSAASDSPITKITARLRLSNSGEPFATVEDFALVSGTVTDGVWRTTQPVTLKMGLTDIGVEVTDASGATVTRQSAGRFDLRGTTRFSEVSISPSTLDADHDTVTYAGQLLVYDGLVSREVGVPGATICLNLNGACVGYGTTDSEGRFSSRAHLYIRGSDTNMIEGDAYASYSGGPQYFRADSTRSHLKVRTQQTRLSVGFSSLPKVIGTTVLVKGRLERKKADGQWTGAAGQDVTIYAYDPDPDNGKWIDFGKAHTRSDGSYSKSVVVPQAGQWFVDFSAPPILNRDGVYVLGPYASSSGGFKDVVYSSYRTSFSRFTMSPNPAGKGAQITANAVLTRRTATGAAVPVKTGYVDLQFSKDKKHWSPAGQSTPGANGQLKIRATAVSSGYWRLLFRSLGDDRNLESVSAIAHATVKYRTAISSLNAKPEPVHKGKTITVSGVLKRYTSAWHPLKAKVNIYFRAHGSKTWSYVGAAAPDIHGKWHKGFKARKDGTWMAKYPGTSVYLPATSAQDYVDVR
ncbi:hypothetical protein [Planotetraspora silvatica]|uniref:hypothetical protein n=1 Tax=Planotetraspora silvatica TaxID=234614 RepID=UPI00194DE692|nr:hypothetical protein [Planotetraspora silvatica]